MRAEVSAGGCRDGIACVVISMFVPDVVAAEVAAFAIEAAAAAAAVTVSFSSFELIAVSGKEVRLRFHGYCGILY